MESQCASFLAPCPSRRPGQMTKVFFTYSGSFFAYSLSVLKRCVPETLAFAFGLRLRSKMRCFKTRVLGRRFPNGKPQERLRFRALRSKTLALKKRIARGRPSGRLHVAPLETALFLCSLVLGFCGCGVCASVWSLSAGLM